MQHTCYSQGMTKNEAFSTSNPGGYSPLILCIRCDVSFHDDRDGVSRALYGHNRNAVIHAGHELEYVTEAEVLATGWTRDEFSAWPYGPVRRAA